MKKISIKKSDVKNFVIDSIVILLGTFIMGLGFTIFLRPNKIVPGGFMGLAQTVYDLLAKVNFTYISISVWYLIFNAFLFLYALKVLGFKFGLRAGVGIASYSLFVELLQRANFVNVILEKITQENLNLGEGSLILFAIYGGILVGVGIGLVFRANGSTGGCDMLALVFRKAFPNITTGQWVIIIDTIVVLLSVFAYQSLILPLYALITIFLTGKISDIFIDGVKSIRAYYILTSKKDEVANIIAERLKRSATNIKCEGMFTHTEKDMLMVMVTKAQIMELKTIIKETDSEAFMFCVSAKEAYGKGFVDMSTIKQNNLKNILKLTPKKKNKDDEK